MIFHWGSVHWGVWRLLLRSLQVSKAWACMVKFSHRFDIWQASRQQRCRDTCQISKRLGKSKHPPRSFEISRDLTIRRPPAYWVLMRRSGGTGWPWYQLRRHWLLWKMLSKLASVGHSAAIIWRKIFEFVSNFIHWRFSLATSSDYYVCTGLVNGWAPCRRLTISKLSADENCWLLVAFRSHTIYLYAKSRNFLNTIALSALQVRCDYDDS